MQKPGGHEIYKRVEFGGPGEIVRGILVPCGKCLICRKNKSAEWATRITHEAQYHQKKCFITLTYADGTVPLNKETGKETLFKRDLQLFIKRLRKEIEPTKIKYFACGEYGKKTMRPHYHIIILGWQPDRSTDLVQVGVSRDGRKRYSSPTIAEKWTKGNIDVSQVVPGSIFYVSGYLIKKQGVQQLQGRQQPFIVASQGIGLAFALQHRQAIRGQNMTAEGRSVSIPKYYIKKLGVDEDVKACNMLKREKITIRYHNKETRKRLLRAVHLSRLQGLKDAQAIQELTARKESDSF